jgi:LPXTG-site transpeptidase (sortase) family protein
VKASSWLPVQDEKITRQGSNFDSANDFDGFEIQGLRFEVPGVKVYKNKIAADPTGRRERLVRFSHGWLGLCYNANSSPELKSCNKGNLAEMSGKGYIAIGLGLFGVILIAAVVLSGAITATPPVPAGFEKGAQLTQVPDPITPLPTGPAEPTPAPSGAVATAFAPASATALAATATFTPAATSLAPVTAATPVTRLTNSIIPVKIKIPAINVDTFIERVGLTKDGLMDVPKNIWNTGWFGNGGYRPGDPGNAVIAGHLDAPGTKAVFWDLDKLKAGDKIILTNQAGKQLTFEVVDKQVYPYNDAPLQQIFGPSPQAHLNLITCGGTFDRASQNYNKRLVVYTRLAAA